MSGGLSRLRKLLIDEGIPELLVNPGAHQMYYSMRRKLLGKAHANELITWSANRMHRTEFL
jgi:hypothetical protein